MKYLMMIYQDESMAKTLTKEMLDASLKSFMAYNQALSKAGVLVGGLQLNNSGTATTIRVRNGKVALTDGPFAEGREQLGGTYTFECKDLDEALSWAKKCPAVVEGWGSVEVRPVMFDPMAALR